MIRISEHQLHHLMARLSERAMTVLRFLAQQRFATTSHLARLLRPHHASPASALRQTSRLTNHLATLHLIRALTRRIGGMRAGSAATIWHLTEPGHRLITRHDADTGTPTRRRWHEPSLNFLTHTLAITETRITIEETARHGPITIRHIEPEPACWRSHLGPYGQPEWVKPDLGLITETDGYQDHWWCEIDLATENPARITTKARAYHRHYQAGTEQATRGIFPRVLWITPHPTRKQQLHRILTKRHHTTGRHAQRHRFGGDRGGAEQLTRKEKTLMNYQPEHTQTGNHQPDNMPETPLHNYPAGAIAAWRQLTGQPPNQPLDPDWHHNFINCYHGSWPNRNAYIETLVEDIFSQQLETITNTIGIPTDYIRWNYPAIWEDATRCFDIIENEDGVHVFER